ncbi:MAG TPA: hypothetical protein VMV52_06735 [Candidatus Nanopelagicaceae bacterium]|nr:hypothetical protein [Candidatus Nanopelagicaceae bacterium]
MRSSVRYLAVPVISAVAISILAAPLVAKASCPSVSQVAAVKAPLRFQETHSSVTSLNKALSCLGYLASVPSSKTLGAVSAAALKKFYAASNVALVVRTQRKAIVFNALAKKALIARIRAIAISKPEPDPVPTSTAGASPSNSPAPYVYALPQEYVQMFAGADWVQSPKLSSGFKTGQVVFDFFSDLYARSYVNSTIESAQQIGAGWFVYENYNTHLSLEPPKLGPMPMALIPQNEHDYQFREASDEELASMISKIHQKGLKFALFSSVNFDGLSREKYGLAQIVVDDIAKGEQRFEALGDAYSNLSTRTAAVSKFWDDWFQTYGDFIVHQADVAQKNGVELLGIGQQLGVAIRTEHADHWKALVDRVRQHYKGEITYSAYASPNNLFSFADWSLLDVATVMFGDNGWTAPNASTKSVAELRNQLASVLAESYKPIFTTYGKKVILQTSLQSATTQEWFEPGPSFWFGTGPPVSTHAKIVKDLDVQARLYEALFQVVKDESWVDGIFAWGYWWKDDLTTLKVPGDSAFDKSPNLRDKPASAIFKKWSAGIGA